MKTTFKLLSILCLLAISLTNCTIINTVDTNIDIRFKNTSEQNIEALVAKNQSIGNLNAGEVSEYFNFNLDENSTMSLSAFIENTNYSNELSVMYIQENVGYCGVGLEQTLMLEEGQDYTLELSTNKDYPNTFIVHLVMD
jgi:hypothetical protein